MAFRPNGRPPDEARQQIDTARRPGAHAEPRTDPACPPNRTGRTLRVLVTVSTLVVGSGVVGVAVAQTPTRRASAPAVGPAAAPPSPGTYRGPAFDACTAPSAAAMKAWGASPYRAMVVYVGGSNRGCKQPNLTAAWVTAQRAAGWHLVPVYVGPQPSCTTAKGKKNLIPAATAGAAGVASATDAVTRARALGMGPDSVLVYDIEPYRMTDQACRTATLTFLTTWTMRLHDLGYLSGLYSGTLAGLPDVVAAYHSPGFVRPDYLDFAYWDNVQNLTHPTIPAAYWTPRRRMKQFRGPHRETWGGVTITVDTDHLDFATLPRTRTGDVNGNGWSDLLALRPAVGVVELHNGTGSRITNRPLATGWRHIDAVTRLGDADRDGRADVIARERGTGRLWLYPGSGTGFGRPVEIGHAGWHTLSEITAVGDVTGDGFADIMAVHTASGVLRLYPGRGAAPVARGVNTTVPRATLDELTGVGDVDGDGRGDVVARVKATGALRLYSGRATGLGPYRQISAAGRDLRQLVGVGDFDRDGVPDLVAVVAATGVWNSYPITPAGLGPGVRLGAGEPGALLF